MHGILEVKSPFVLSPPQAVLSVILDEATVVLQVSKTLTWSAVIFTPLVIPVAEGLHDLLRQPYPYNPSLPLTHASLRLGPVLWS